MTRGYGPRDKKPQDIGRRQEKQPSGKNLKKVKLNLQTSKALEHIPVLPKGSVTGVLNEGPGSLRKLTILSWSGNDSDILEPFAMRAVKTVSLFKGLSPFRHNSFLLNILDQSVTAGKVW